MTPTFEIIPIPTAFAEMIRATRRDASGDPVVAVAADGSGHPCRHCLQDGERGETMLLVSYCPFTTEGPYREVGPIFVHDRACARYAGHDVIPEQLRRRLLALRGYDRRGNMIAADVVDGKTMDGLLGELLGRPDVELVHVRNARPGCFACEVRRPS